MSNAIYVETLSLSEDVCALLRQVDPSAFRDELEADSRARVDRITGRLRALVEVTEQEQEPGPGRVARMGDRLRGLLAAIERAAPSPSPARREAWTAFQREVQPAYESLAQSLRGFVAAPPTVRPTNHTRSLFHVGSGLFALAIIRLLPGRAWLVGVAFAFMAAGWTMEIMRRRSDGANARIMRVFSPVAHPHEWHRVNSATWYVSALFLLSVFAPPLGAEVGVVVLALADPVAAFVGRRIGRTRLRHNRSLEGSLAFFAAAAVGAFAVLAVFHPMALPSALALTAAAAAVGAVVELFSTRLDDNFTIPVSVATALAVLAPLLGVTG